MSDLTQIIGTTMIVAGAVGAIATWPKAIAIIREECKRERPGDKK